MIKDDKKYDKEWKDTSRRLLEIVDIIIIATIVKFIYIQT